METTTLKMTRWMTHLLLAITAGGTLGVAWEFKETIALRENLEETQIKARTQLEELRSKNPFKTIQRSIEKVQTNEAFEKLNRLDRNMKSLEGMLTIKRGEELENIFVEHKNKIQDATAYSRPDEILQTLTSKVERLSGLARSRNWKNLLRGGERMEARLEQLRTSQKMESPLVRFMESDLNAMAALIKGSSLEDGDKNEVLRQLEGIRQEIAMLMDLHQSRKGLMVELDRADAAMGRWAARADLAIGTLKHSARQAMETSLMHLWVIAAILLAGWGVLGVAWAWSLRDQRRDQDQELLSVLHDGVLGDKAVWETSVGAARADECHSTIRVIKKRLRLGEDFQAAMPFGSALIDSHGQLIWGNTLFSEQFGVSEEELTEEHVGWSQLATRLSGLEVDPIELALHEQQMGTWQVQLHMEDGVAVPFEMHVSPVSNKVLVVFYPLALMKETIRTQAALVMEPVRQALEALESERWGLELEEKLAPQWRQAGLADDWQLLSRSIHRMDQTRNTLMKQVAQLEDEKHDHLKTIADLTEGLESRSRTLKAQAQSLKDMRDNLVSLDQLGADLALEHSALLNGSRSLARRQDQLIESLRGLSERFVQAKDSVSAMEKFKADYRAGKQDILENKQELVNLHNRFLGTLPALSERAEDIAAAMKEALIRLDRATAQLDSRMTSMEVQLTKLSMAFVGNVNEAEKPVVVDFGAHERVAREIAQAMQEDQEAIVERLRKMVDELRQDAQSSARLREQVLSDSAPMQDV